MAKANFYEVELAGEIRPIKYSLLAMANFCRNEGIKLDDLQSGKFQPDLLGMMKLTHYALAEGARLKGESFRHSFEDEVAPWLSDDEEGFARCLDYFAQDQPLPEKEKDDVGKKPQAPKKKA